MVAISALRSTPPVHGKRPRKGPILSGRTKGILSKEDVKDSKIVVLSDFKIPIYHRHLVHVSQQRIYIVAVRSLASSMRQPRQSRSSTAFLDMVGGG